MREIKGVPTKKTKLLTDTEDKRTFKNILNILSMSRNCLNREHTLDATFPVITVSFAFVFVDDSLEPDVKCIGSLARKIHTRSTMLWSPTAKSPRTKGKEMG